MKISISNLSEGDHAFHFSAEPSHLGLGDPFKKLVSVDVSIEKTSREVFLKAEARTIGTFLCDRCVDEFDRAVGAAYRMVYIYDARDKEKYDGQEVQLISAGTMVIDISDDVRQFILLAVPLKLLCREGCLGLCPHCGINRNSGTCSCEADIIGPRGESEKRHFP